jgi:RND family efflux transporter MFP subunit
VSQPNPRLIRRLGALLVAAVAAGIAYWVFLGRGPEVDVVRPTRGPVVAAVYATGSVEPVTWARLGPTVRGRIVSYPVREGSHVEAGDLIAQLDDSEQRAAVLKMEAELDFRRRTLRRIEPLGRRDFATAANVEQAQSALAQGEADLDVMRKRLADLALHAPFAGTVIRKDFEVGDLPGPDDTLVWLAGPGGLWITAEVDEEDLPRIHVGQETLIKADAFPGQVFRATLDVITPKGDPVEKSYRVRVRLPEDTVLKVGMTVEINVVNDKRDDALLVPATALVDGALWTVRDGHARRVTVEPGVRGTDRVEIKSGIADDEQIILVPPKTLAEGQRVRATDATARVPIPTSK